VGDRDSIRKADSVTTAMALDRNTLKAKEDSTIVTARIHALAECRYVTLC